MVQLPKNDSLKKLSLHGQSYITSIPYTKLDYLSIANISINEPTEISVQHLIYNKNDITYFKYIKDFTKLELTTTIESMNIVSKEKLLDKYDLEELSLITC